MVPPKRYTKENNGYVAFLMNRPRIGWEIEVDRVVVGAGRGGGGRYSAHHHAFLKQASGQMCKDDVNRFSFISYISSCILRVGVSYCKREDFGLIQTFVM
jgi:hypothetical protein